MPVLAAMVEDNFTDGGAMTRTGLACTWRLLELHGPAALNSLCRLLAAAGLAPRLVAALGAAADALAAVSLPVRCRALPPRLVPYDPRVLAGPFACWLPLPLIAARNFILCKVGACRKRAARHPRRSQAPPSRARRAMPQACARLRRV